MTLIVISTTGDLIRGVVFVSYDDCYATKLRFPAAQTGPEVAHSIEKQHVQRHVKLCSGQLMPSLSRLSCHIILLLK